MVDGGRPLIHIVPDMAVQDTAHLLEVFHRRYSPDFAEEMTRSVEHDRLDD
jgi:hypothetical protein